MKKLLPLFLLSLPAFAQVCQQPVCISVPVATLAGPGDLNDAASGGAFASLPANNLYVVTIYSTGTPDRFEWTVNGGSPPILHPTIVGGSCALPAIAGMNGWQPVADGVLVCFLASTGHTLADYWTISTTANGTIAQQTFVQTGMGATVARNAQDKARETVNMLDYHLRSETDYAPAFARGAAALAARGGGTLHVSVPPGVAQASYPISNVVIGGAGYDSIKLECDQGVTLLHTGTGIGVLIGQVVTAGVNRHMGAEGCVVYGNSGTTHAWQFESVKSSAFKNLRGRNATSPFLCESCVSDKFETMIYTEQDGATAIHAADPFVADYDPANTSSTSQDNQLIDPTFENYTDAGFWAKHAVDWAVQGGTFESGVTGARTDSTSSNICFWHVDVEGNSTEDYNISGAGNCIDQGQHTGSGIINITASAALTRIGPGFYGVINNAGTNTEFSPLAFMVTKNNSGAVGTFDCMSSIYLTAGLSPCYFPVPVYATTNLFVSGGAGPYAGVTSAGGINTILQSLDSAGFGLVGTASNHPLGLVANGAIRDIVPADGGIQMSSVSPPTCNAAHEGTVFYFSGSPSSIQMCMELASGGYAYTLIVQGGLPPALHGANTNSAVTGITVATSTTTTTSCTATIITAITCTSTSTSTSTPTDPGHVHVQN